MYRYEAAETRPTDGGAAACGIVGWQERDGSWHPVVVTAPFSTDRKAVLQLAERCTALQLAPCDLMEELIAFRREGDGNQIRDRRSRRVP